jgi:hypothetical protein
MTQAKTLRNRIYIGAGVLVASLTLLFSSVLANASPVKAAAAVPPASGTTVMLNPNRIADSRSDLSFPTFEASWSQDLQVAGRGGVPLNGVAAVILNVTAVNPQYAGYLTVWPFGISRTSTSSLNFSSGQTIANTVIVRLSTDGTISLYNGSRGDVDVLVDVEGYIPR